MSKQDNRIQVTPEQREAILKYQKDFKKALPLIGELGKAAKDMHDALISSPTWSIVDTPKPEDAQPELWTVGHAQVNYVDHIQTSESEGTQDK